MRKMHVSTMESITQHKSPRMTNHSACGRFGRVYNNTGHKTWAHMHDKSYMSECTYILSPTSISRLILRISD